jgi:ferredoxin/predicted transcriptional regulator
LRQSLDFQGIVELHSGTKAEPVPRFRKAEYEHMTISDRQNVPENDIYRRLQEHIDSMPVPYPATQSGVELRLLQHLFSPEEAEVALALSAVPEPVRRIYGRLKATDLSRDDVARMLRRLAKKGAISAGLRKARTGPERVYGKLPLAVGMFEMQVDRLTEEYVNDFHQYMNEGFREAFATKRTGQMRTVPIEAAIDSQKLVGSYDDIKAYIRESDGPFAVINCVCRQGSDLIGKHCAHSSVRETCLMIGEFAGATAANGHGRRVSKTEMLELIDRADAESLVLQPQNNRNPRFICCCCGDCCEVLTNVKKLPKPAEYFVTNYYASVDRDRCTACGVCERRCQMDAVALVERVARIDLDRCIGCGLCTSACPSRAMTLEPKRRLQVPPKTVQGMYAKILRERVGPLGMVKALAKLLLRRKL